MARLMGSLRRVAFAPSLASVGFAERGFPCTPTDATAALEEVPQAVVCGFEWAIEDPKPWEIERRLGMVRPEHRGFAYEGATMAFTILDAMPGRGGRVRDLLTGPGHEHLFLAYIGIGFAMARLPRRLWRHVVPDLGASPYHPTMSWLAVDGYGFDRAYFDTRRWVDEQYVPQPYPWQGAPAYFQRAVDQGVGRALWFVHGGSATGVSEAVTRFPAARQADLWSGVGLAATFAGGCDPAGLAALRDAAGAHAVEVALGCVFAVKARTFASYVPEHTTLGAAVFTGLDVGAVVELADGTAAGPATAGDVPAYELWRQRIRDGLAATGGRAVA